MPQQIKRFRTACWIGLALGGMWALLLGAASVGVLLTPIPGSPPSMFVFLTPVAAILQVSCACLLLKGRLGVLPLFCIGSVGVAISLLLTGGFFFASFNLVPIALIWWSAKPGLDRAETRDSQKTGPVTQDPSDGHSTPTEFREDLY